MIKLPLRSIAISDFRRLQGSRTIPLDAPVVLLHGPNGAGKTSVLSALELALTGDIRSMRRHDDRYTAHLPYHGQEFSTLRAEIAPELDRRAGPEPMTVGGSRIEGLPAMAKSAAQFYSERCFLDQASLGRLLELYEHTEGKEESALARFVNEILGLEQLDALRAGLHDALDFRRLKNLSEPLDAADDAAKEAKRRVQEATAHLRTARNDLGQAREALVEVLQGLGVDQPGRSDDELVGAAGELADSIDADERIADLESTVEELTRIFHRAG